MVREATLAVVNIYARKGRSADPFLAPRLRCLFEDCGGRSLPRSVPENSPGPGVIGAADGLIVTDPHVIQREHQLPWHLGMSAPGTGARR